MSSLTVISMIMNLLGNYLCCKMKDFSLDQHIELTPSAEVNLVKYIWLISDRLTFGIKFFKFFFVSILKSTKKYLRN